MATAEHLGLFEKYGLPGLVIAALFGLIVYLNRGHREDRGEWLSSFKVLSQHLIDVSRESNEVTRQLTKAVEAQASRRRLNDYDDHK